MYRNTFQHSLVPVRSTKSSTECQWDEFKASSSETVALRKDLNDFILCEMDNWKASECETLIQQRYVTNSTLARLFSPLTD